MKLIMYFIGFVLAAFLIGSALVWADNLCKSVDTPEWKCPFEKNCNL